MDSRRARDGQRQGRRARRPGTSSDRICLDGKPLDLGGSAETVEVLLYHKPVGEVTTRSDPENRPTVFERLPQPRSGRWIVVGRLDVNTSGSAAVHQRRRARPPAHAPLQRSAARIPGAAAWYPRAEVLDRLRRGVELEDGRANFDSIEPESTEGSHSWYRVGLHEGRNREVRRLFEHEGFIVSRLSRLRYGSVELPRDLRGGAFIHLDYASISALSKLASPAPSRG